MKHRLSSRQQTHFRDGRRRVGRAENGAAHHGHVDAATAHLRDVGGADAAVHLDQELQPAGFAQLTQGNGLFRHFRNERLAAKTRIDRHQQHHVGDVQHGLDQFHRRGGVERHAGTNAGGGDLRQRPVQMTACLLMNDKVIGAGFEEHVEKVFAGLDHQVNVDDGVRIAAAQRLDDRRTVGQVGDEMAVHYVHVQPVEIVFQRVDGGADRQRIGGKNRRRDQKRLQL